jgi:hypothetical protein
MTTVIELADTHLTRDEVIDLAKERVVVVGKSDGCTFALSQRDDCEVEVERLGNHRGVLSFLSQLSREDASIPLEDLRKELAL